MMILNGKMQMRPLGNLFTVIALVMPGLAPAAFAASAPMKVTVHVPSKSLSIMPYYFGKDKGFFAAEQI